MTSKPSLQTSRMTPICYKDLYKTWVSRVTRTCTVHGWEAMRFARLVLGCFVVWLATVALSGRVPCTQSVWSFCQWLLVCDGWAWVTRCMHASVRVGDRLGVSSNALTKIMRGQSVRRSTLAVCRRSPRQRRESRPVQVAA